MPNIASMLHATERRGKSGGNGQFYSVFVFIFKTYICVYTYIWTATDTNNVPHAGVTGRPRHPADTWLGGQGTGRGRPTAPASRRWGGSAACMLDHTHPSQGNRVGDSLGFLRGSRVFLGHWAPSLVAKGGGGEAPASPEMGVLTATRVPATQPVAAPEGAQCRALPSPSSHTTAPQEGARWTQGRDPEAPPLSRAFCAVTGGTAPPSAHSCLLARGFLSRWHLGPGLSVPRDLPPPAHTHSGIHPHLRSPSPNRTPGPLLGEVGGPRAQGLCGSSARLGTWGQRAFPQGSP